ncbi:MAG: hypothetical protein OJF50_003935 [Nitrospira sp.]|nr:hypothetical protein [Nitrospira sp.]
MNSYRPMCELRVIIITIFLLLSLVATAQARSDYDVGTGIGFVSGSPDGTNFAQSFQMDWRIVNGRNSILGRFWTSVGPYVQFVPPGPYMHVAGAIVARLHWHFLDHFIEDCDDCKLHHALTLSPFIGMGGMHAQLNQAGGITQDFSYYSPVGLSLDYDFLRRFGVSVNFVHNFHDLNVGNGGGHDRGSEAFFFTIRFNL